MAKAQKMGHKAKQPPKVATCSQGHEIYRVLVVPIKGRQKFAWACDCSVTPFAGVFKK